MSTSHLAALTLVVPLCGLGNADPQLAPVGVDAHHAAVSGRAGERRDLRGVARDAVQRLGDVRRPLQDDVLPTRGNGQKGARRHCLVFRTKHNRAALPVESFWPGCCVASRTGLQLGQQLVSTAFPGGRADEENGHFNRKRFLVQTKQWGLLKKESLKELLFATFLLQYLKPELHTHCGSGRADGCTRSTRQTPRTPESWTRFKTPHSYRNRPPRWIPRYSFA